MDIELDDQTIKTRSDIAAQSAQISGQLNKLSHLIETRLEQVRIDKEVIFSFRSRFLQRLFDNLFIARPLVITVCLAGLVLALLTVLEGVDLARGQLDAVMYTLFAVAALYIAVLVVVSLKQVSRLIARTARLKTMILFYFSLIIAYAVMYLILVTISPDSLRNVGVQSYFPALLSLQRFVDCLYFSCICQSATGFGDVTFYSQTGRIVSFTQSLISVAYMNILFSNWIS